MLDTNALSAWAAADVSLMRILPKDRPWRLPVIALGEFLFGVRQSRDRTRLEGWLGEVVEVIDLVGVDAGTADHYADIREELRRAATPIPENDIWIAASCRQHGLAIASRDTHLDKVKGLRRIAW